MASEEVWFAAKRPALSPYLMITLTDFLKWLDVDMKTGDVFLYTAIRTEVCYGISSKTLPHNHLREFYLQLIFLLRRKTLCNVPFLSLSAMAPQFFSPMFSPRKAP
jgi:hypothetical protein